MKIDRELFLSQRAPRRGRKNPERFDMPVWAWLVERGVSAYTVNQEFAGPSAFDAGPGWCFDRFGCSRTELPDGRVLHVGGEHEDHYDPDFYIYNDAILRHPDGSVQIFGYPEKIFPPTDFHSATLQDERVWLLGNLGYDERRKPGTTPVFTLDIATMAIRGVATKGAGPGWIHRHSAEFQGDALIVRGGEVFEGGELVENHAVWALDPRTRRWSQISTSPFQQWIVHRVDGEPMLLFELGMAAFEADCPEMAEVRQTELPAEEFLRLGIDLDPNRRLEAAGCTFDPAVYSVLYAPDLPHEVLAGPGDDTEFGRSQDHTCLRVGGAVVRYAERLEGVVLRVEGELPEHVVRQLTDDLVGKLSALHGVPCAAERSDRPRS
ncbi:MAG: hypothetical protein KDC87_08830 [Planctomycetes bacterium]|nr:hypothetical protein [Planctomycetota bacterium]MCB9872087.1 hypothetical protein [Planctomycetota bacterium]